MTSPSPPSLIVVGFDEIVASTFGRGSFELNMLVQGLAGKPTDKSAQIRLDEWLSPLGTKNVWTAIESDRTLGGKVDDVRVLRSDGSQFIRLDDGSEVLGSTWHVHIQL